MCGRYVFDFSAEDFEAYFRLAPPAAFGVRYNVAPTQDVPVVVEAEDGGRMAVRMHWGFLRKQRPEEKKPPLVINARAETVFERETFRVAMAYRARCLIPASGWYEWQRLPSGDKQPMLIRRKDGKPLAFAGLWQVRYHPTEPLVKARTAVIITAAAAPAIAEIHDRMPLALPETKWNEWLGSRKPLARDWLVKAREDMARRLRLVAIPVSKLVNSVRFDDADCVASTLPCFPNPD